jgi:hypothetical protein
MTSPTLLKARQTSKIAEIGEALRAAGVITLNTQAEVLGLSRSTTYTVVAARHKNSGISGRILARMLRSDRLPLSVRAAIEDYAKEKLSGAYGGDKRHQRRFIARLEQERLSCQIVGK